MDVWVSSWAAAVALKPSNPQTGFLHNRPLCVPHLLLKEKNQSYDPSLNFRKSDSRVNIQKSENMQRQIAVGRKIDNNLNNKRETKHKFMLVFVSKQMFLSTVS